MFDLEKAIAQWRQEMIQAGIRKPVPMDELETHLRDAVRAQMNSGATQQEAFARSVRELGEPQTMRHDFARIRRQKLKRRAIIAAGIAGIFVGPALILPALAWRKAHGSMPLEQTTDLMIGVLILVSGLGLSALSFKKRAA